MLDSEIKNCWLKIGRAEEHAKIIGDEISFWTNAKLYVLTHNRDAEGYFHHVSVDFTVAPERERWSLIFGDCIHNLRSALDHFVYAVAVHQTKIDPPADKRILQFPITNSPENFVGQEFRIKSLSPAVGTSIEGVQPYNRRHASLPPMLALVRDFDDLDKHRLLNMAIFGQQVWNIGIKCPPGHRVAVCINPGEIENRGDIMGFTVAPPSLDVAYDYTAGFSVGIRHDPGPSGSTMTGVRILLPMLCEEIRTVIETISKHV
jgi:hypothetical protein